MKKLPLQFYEPIMGVSGQRAPVIIYPSVGLERAMPQTELAVVDHVSQLLHKYPLDVHIQYAVVILWDNDREAVADVWQFSKTETWGSGPLVDVRVYSCAQPLSGQGISAGDGLLLLGAEERLRRSCDSLAEYLSICPRGGRLVGVSLHGEYSTA
jgi:hypothetical protein